MKQKHIDIVNRIDVYLSKYNFACVINIKEDGTISIELGNLIHSKKICDILYKAQKELNITNDFHLCGSQTFAKTTKHYTIRKKKIKSNVLIDRVFNNESNIVEIKKILKQYFISE